MKNSRRSFIGFIAGLPLVGVAFGDSGRRKFLDDNHRDMQKHLSAILDSVKKSINPHKKEDEILDGFDPASPQIYREYKIKWTGWKLTQKDDTAVGQWVAYPTTSKAPPGSPVDMSRPYLYSSTPGCYGSVPRGGTFDIAKRQGQVVVLSTTRPEIKAREMKKAGRKLIKMIDAVMDSGKRDLTVLEWNDFLRKKRVI